MPKQQVALNKFEGGLHTDADPRDIAGNAFSALKGFSVDSLGIIKLMVSSSAATGFSIDAIDITDGMNPGYGMFAFSSDYAENGVLSSTDYLVVNQGSYVNIWDYTGGNPGNWNDMVGPPINLGESSATTTDQKLSYYAPNGDLRVSDGEFSNHANLVKWLGYITKRTYGEGTSTDYPTTFAQTDVGFGTTPAEGWLSANASVEAGLTSANLKMINLGHKTKGLIEGSPRETTFTDTSCDTTDTDATVDHDDDSGKIKVGMSVTGTGIPDGAYVASVTSNERFELSAVATATNDPVTLTFGVNIISAVSGNNITIFRTQADASNGTQGILYGQGTLSASDNYYNGMTCSCGLVDGTTVYGVVYLYDYDSSGKSVFSVWFGVNGNINAATAGVAVTSSFQVGQSDGYHWKSDYTLSNHTRGVIAREDYGVTLAFAEADSGDGNWMPESTTRYKFYHSTIYDDTPFGFNAQESLPQLFTMYKPKFAAGTNTHDATDEMYFSDLGDSFSGTGDTDRTPSVELPIDFGIFIRIKGDNTADGAGAGKNFTIGNSAYDTTDQDAVDAHGAYNFNGANARTRGGRIYWASNEDGYRNLFLLMEYDLEKGGRTVGAGGSTSIGAYAEWRSWVYPVATSQLLRPNFTGDQARFYDPPTIETYESLNLHSTESKLNAKWKTAVIANGRAYIGNVKRQEKSTFNGGGSWSSTVTDDPEYQDRILKSLTGQYDKFPEGQGFELESLNSDDGDYIVKLETFADRLFVFQKYKLQILNIEKGTESLEAEYKGLGLDGGHTAQSISFGFGIAWMNSTGVYYYDGQKVSSLTDNKIRNMWVGEDGYIAFWKGGTDGTDGGADVPIITYNPVRKEIICLKTCSKAGSDEEDVLVYGLKTKAWTYDEDYFYTTAYDRVFTIFKGTNIHSRGADFKQLGTSASTSGGSGSVLIHTKDFDFGAPGVRKTIHRVYVTYQSAGGDTNIQIHFGVNGNTTIDKTFRDGTNFASNELAAATGWQVADLKPTSISDCSKIYSFRLGFTTPGAVPPAFEINDITVVYRVKEIR